MSKEVEVKWLEEAVADYQRKCVYACHSSLLFLSITHLFMYAVKSFTYLLLDSHPS